jgi:serine/threonine protein kinase
MGPERFRRLKDLFADACDLPAGERRPYLERLTRDAALIEEALELARENDVNTSRATHISQPAFALIGDVPELKAGDSLGPWKLMEEIGRGGMGAVFRAERADGHFRQTSAVKVLQGRPTPGALDYLEKERQILASLSHPHIARLLDGGTTPHGRPYLVMEHVEGMPIDHYCQAKHLSMEQCLALFLGVCDAISFAHQRLVIHCDIKPANVLVDRRGRAVVLDFGIARLVNRVGKDDASGALAFTPGFASPEQRSGETLGTAADTYGLGKLLDAIVQVAPERSRGWELGRIIAKAAADAPGDRYPTAFMLADDVRRYLARQPLRAIPSSAPYRLRKYAERHPIEVVVVIVFVFMFVAALLRIGDEHNAAVLARKEAEVQRDRARKAEAEVARQRDLSSPRPDSSP